MPFIKKFLLLIIAIIIANLSITNAAVTLPQIIGNNMVLQRDQPVPIWGNADPGEKIIVVFNHQEKRIKADADGKWKVWLDPLKASFTPQDLTIKGDNTIILKNVLVGEVWFTSGQSNMAYTMRMNSKVTKTYATGYSPVDELDYAKNKNIRIFLGDRKRLMKVHPNHEGWAYAEDSALRSFSAASYFFAKELYAKLHVPIGVISSAIPGSAIEPWLGATISSTDSTGRILKVDTSKPGKFYPTLIETIAPFAIKGILWYQGETNCFQNESIGYTYKMQLLINEWRSLWNKTNLPFYYVQIAPFYYSKSAGKYPLDKYTLPKFWEAQTLALKIPYTGMAVINDLPDNLDNIHPPGKWEVGRRLALIALAKNYHQDIEYSGPMFSKMTIEGNKIIIAFTHTDKGLKSSNGRPLDNFEIAGADGIFKPADVSIDGNKIIVWNPFIKNPVNVRFAWKEDAQPNFYNGDNLPAVPFRTDNPYQNLSL